MTKTSISCSGSSVFRPLIKYAPIINKILPVITDEQLAIERDYAYSSLAEAVAKIKELEVTIESMEDEHKETDLEKADLLAELERLKEFEKMQSEFEEREKEFDKNVVFAEAAPSIEEYKNYYEEINPTNAEQIYRQVVEQLQYTGAIKEKADLFKSMDPEAAAKILETMTADVESVAKILLAMKPKEGAAILAEMDNVLAAKITKKMLDMDEERLASE